MNGHRLAMSVLKHALYVQQNDVATGDADAVARQQLLDANLAEPAQFAAAYQALNGILSQTPLPQNGVITHPRALQKIARDADTYLQGLGFKPMADDLFTAFYNAQKACGTTSARTQ